MTKKEYKVRWADVDMNGHLRHSAYADFCAHARVEILEEIGLGLKEMRKLAMGPILFKEELVYKREVGLNEVITIESHLISARRDASRWEIGHLIYKSNGILACEVKVQGAWMDLRARKLGALPIEFAEKMLALPKTELFSWND